MINQIVKIGRDDDMMIVLDSRGLGAVNSCPQRTKSVGIRVKDGSSFRHYSQCWLSPRCKCDPDDQDGQLNLETSVRHLEYSGWYWWEWWLFFYAVTPIIDLNYFLQRNENSYSYLHCPLWTCKLQEKIQTVPGGGWIFSIITTARRNDCCCGE